MWLKREEKTMLFEAIWSLGNLKLNAISVYMLEDNS